MITNKHSISRRGLLLGTGALGSMYMLSGTGAFAQLGSVDPDAAILAAIA